MEYLIANGDLETQTGYAKAVVLQVGCTLASPLKDLHIHTSPYQYNLNQWSWDPGFQIFKPPCTILNGQPRLRNMTLPTRERISSDDEGH